MTILILNFSVLFSEEFSFNESEFRTVIEQLSSDEFMGRGTQQRGIQLAADYLVKKFATYKLQAIGDQETYYQNVPMVAYHADKKTKFKAYLSDTTLKFNLYDDYVLNEYGEQTLIPKPTELVFAGYGIYAPQFDYNDYQEIDVEDKVVVIITGEPYSEDMNYFSGNIPSIHSSIETKRRVALAQGAKGCMFIPDPYEYNTIPWEQRIEKYLFDEINLPYRPTAGFSVILKPESAFNLFYGADYSLPDVYEMFINNDMRSFNMKAKIEFDGVFKNNEFYSSNIIGMIEGSDDSLRNTYVIVSAHYDHMGIGPAVQGDSIYNGVMDNSVGVAALLEIMRNMKEKDIKTKRSIIFLATTGEEYGMLGSSYYCDHPSKDLDKTIANVNIDGLAFIDRFKSIIPLGVNYSTLDSVIVNIAKKNNLTVEHFPTEIQALESFNLSDQMAFAKAGVPSCMILEGTDYENIEQELGLKQLMDYMNNRYHTPFDDLNLPINYSAIEQHIKLIFDVVINLANSEQTILWNDNSPFKSVYPSDESLGEK